jgi:hypothetical protein
VFCRLFNWRDAIVVVPEVEIPTSIGGGGVRAREIGAGRPASRVFARNGVGGCLMVRQEPAEIGSAPLFAEHS